MLITYGLLGFQNIRRAPTLMPKPDVRLGLLGLSRLLWMLGEEFFEGQLSCFGSRRHRLKVAGRLFHRPASTSTMNFPAPGLSRPASSFYDKRKIGRVKFFPHTR